MDLTDTDLAAETYFQHHTPSASHADTEKVKACVVALTRCRPHGFIRRTEAFKNPENLKNITDPCATFEEFFARVARQPFSRWAEMEQTYPYPGKVCPGLIGENFQRSPQPGSALGRESQSPARWAGTGHEGGEGGYW